MRTLLSILLMLLMGMCAYATTFTLTIDSKNSASVVCEPASDQPSSLGASYVTTGSSKDRITATDSAQMTLLGLPSGEISQITLYMKSNSNAGAATVKFSIGDSTWVVARGDYKDWVKGGSFSNEYAPIQWLKSPIKIERKSSLTIDIKGSKNSVYIQKMVVDFTAAPKQAYSVCLQWSGPDHTFHTQLLKEDSVGAGVQLPAIDSAYLTHEWNSQTWYWIGWSEHWTDTTSTQPLTWETGNWYFPDDQCNLYAIYSNAYTHHLTQDTSFSSGQYALVTCINQSYWALTGNWNESRIAMAQVNMQMDESDRLVWSMDALNTPYRYQLAFTSDSVSLKNIATNTWVGYGSVVKSQPKLWAWRRSADGTVFLYNQWNEKMGPNSTLIYSSKALDVDWYNNTWCAANLTVNYESTYPYWRLFPVGDVPVTQQALYTSFPLKTALPAVRKCEHGVCAPTKVMTNGKIRIIHLNQQYDLLGRIL